MEIILKYFSDFTPAQLKQFEALKGLYEMWNEKINVISRKDIAALYEKHVLHSLSIAAIADFQPDAQILDLGTGGGFPGIPLAIFFPEVQFHLVDAIGKKIKVVQDIAETLQLRNVTTAHSRAESIKNRKFDIVVSRAVAPLADLWRWSKPLLKKSSVPGKRFEKGLIALKGGDLAQEIADSGIRPQLVQIYDLFPEESFKEKFIVLAKN